jgi:hypothetical protein
MAVTDGCLEGPVSSPYESATLLLKLYDLRREAKMREARTWFATSFHPSSVDDISLILRDPTQSASFRMVVSYWDMAASLVLNDAIDEQMFAAANGEHIGVFAKLEPFIGELRSTVGNPVYLASLERIVMQTPNATERLVALRERFRAMAAARQ